MIIETRIAGIPCIIDVISYVPRTPSNRGFGPPDTDPYDPGEFDFQVLDRKGYPAPWLESKVTDDDRARLQYEFNEANQPDPDRYRD